MYKVWWFAELLPKYKILEEKMLNVIAKSYKQYGYTPIETPMVENNLVLTAKWWGEVKNQIFWLYGLANWVDDLKKYSLRFDLTIPLSRYILDYRGQITFPFKRNQIWKVFRGERTQRGRYKDFYQADIDVIWENNLNNDYLFYDAEVMKIAYETFEKIFSEFDLQDTVIQIHVNNKKIISGFLASLGIGKELTPVSILIDKKDKITEQDFEQQLFKLWLNDQQIEKINKFIKYEITFENLEWLKDVLEIDNKEFDAWIFELKKVWDFCNILWIPKGSLKVNLAIIRWLEYYTGTLFETFITDDRKLGSIGSWWRYEKLTNGIDPKTNFSWVGFSLWVTRLEDYLFENINSSLLAETTSEYLIINFADTLTDSLQLYNTLIQEWRNIEFFPESEKLSKQFKYANNKKIRFCIILWSQEKQKWVYVLKDMLKWTGREVKI